MFTIGVTIQVQAQIQTFKDGWAGSRQVPTFMIPGQFSNWDAAGANAIDILFPTSVPPEVTQVSVTLVLMDDEATSALLTYTGMYGNFLQG